MVKSLILLAQKIRFDQKFDSFKVSLFGNIFLFRWEFRLKNLQVVDYNIVI